MQVGAGYNDHHTSSRHLKHVPVERIFRASLLDHHGTYSLALRVTELLCCPAMLYILQCYSLHTDARKRACITSGITKPFRDSGQNGRIIYLTIHADSMAECPE